MSSSRVAMRCLLASGVGAVLLFARATPAGLHLRYEPLFTVGETTTTEQLGATIHSSTTAWTHLANARLDLPMFENLRLGATTNFEWGLGSASTGGQSSEFDSRAWNTHVQLTAGPQELRLTPFYTRTERTFETLLGGTAGAAPRRLREAYGGHAGWRPVGLPTVGIGFTRTDQLEGGGALLDTSTTHADLETSYVLQNTDLRYRLDYDNPVDHLSGLESVSVRHQARAGYGDRFLGDRVAVSGAYTLNTVTVDTKLSGTGGTLETRQPLVSGRSAIEAPPATPTSIELARTPALVDGDHIASTGLNLGFRASAGGDVAPRHAGAELANAITPVNVAHVWVDRPLPEVVVRAFSWAAYRSDDNLSWTPVTVSAVAFGAFDNRFEITIERTEARYLKVVTRPLPLGTVLDSRFQDILVTEIELLERVPAEAARGRSARTAGFASAGLRARLLQERRLFYDFALNLTHATQERGGASDTVLSYDLTNGVSYEQALGRALSFSGRLDRTDSRQRSRNQSATRLSASLSAFPIPTLTSTATYSGAVTQAPEGLALTNTVLVFVQAQPLQGIAVQANASYGLGTQGGETTQTHSAAVATTVTPNPAITLSGSYSQYSSRRDAAGTTRSATRRLEGAFTFSPLEALYLAASAARVVVEGRTQRIADVRISLRPFPRGAVYLSVSYNESFDFLFDTRTRSTGPSLRWNIHRGNYLEASYSLLDSWTPLLNTHQSLLAVKLSVSL